MTRPTDLPNYANPPIDEVVISLPFVVIPGLSDAIIGLFWMRVRDEFPRTESLPGMGLQVEDFSQNASPVGTPPMLGGTGFFSPIVQGVRTWFTSEDDVYVLQVQNGRFTQNWRRRNDPYPRFERLMDNYWSYYGVFCELLREEQLPRPQIQQVELSYVNWIPDLAMATFLRSPSPAITMPGIDQRPENQIVVFRYVIRANTDPVGTPIARLHVDARPAMRITDDEQQLGTQFTLSFRSPLLQAGTDMAELNERFEFGREAIVRTFTDFTSDAAHDYWGLLSQ